MKKNCFALVLIFLVASASSPAQSTKPAIRKSAGSPVTCTAVAAPDALCTAAGDRVVRWEIYNAASSANLVAGAELLRAGSPSISRPREIRAILEERLQLYLETLSEIEPPAGLGFAAENLANKGAANGYPSLDSGVKIPVAQLPTGQTATTVPFGNDARFTDDRIASGIRTATTVVAVSSAAAPSAGLVLKAINATSASWQADATGGGSDPWTYVKLASDFATTSATAVDVTGMSFTPAASTSYEFEGLVLLRTTTATVNPRLGLAWPTGFTDGGAILIESQAATGNGLSASGNPNAALLVAVGGLPNTTQSWPAKIWGSITMGASPSGTVRLQLASETSGTNVTMQAGSFFRYRPIT